MKAPAILLRRDEALAKGVRHLARALIDIACNALENDKDSGRAVHETRKALKKVRALLQLIAPEFGRTQFKKEKARFRDAARFLAPIRDAQVRLKTFDALIHGAEFVPEEFAKLRAELEAEATYALRHAAAPKRQALEVLHQAREAIRRWPVADLEWESMHHQVQCTYRKGREALQCYRDESTPEAFHEWRKYLKQTWYQLRILRDLLPGTKKEIEALEELGELAGTAQDLTVLRENLTARKAGVETALIIGAIDFRLPEISKAALKKGLQVFAQKPRDFAKK